MLQVLKLYLENMEIVTDSLGSQEGPLSMIQLTRQRAQGPGLGSGQSSDCPSLKTEVDFSKVQIRRRL